MNTPLISTGGTLMGLSFLIALFALALWFIKRSQSPRSSRDGPLQVLATQAIGPGQQLLIVRVAEQTLLLGAGPQSVNLICEIDTALARTDSASASGAPSATAAGLASLPATGPALAGAFGTMLQGMLRR